MARRPGVDVSAAHGDLVTDHKDSPETDDYPHGDLPGGHIDMPAVKARAEKSDHADFVTDHKDNPGRDDYPHGDLPGGHIDMAGFRRVTGGGRRIARQHVDLGARRWQNPSARRTGHVDLPGLAAKESEDTKHYDFKTDHKDRPETDTTPHDDIAPGHIDQRA